MLQQAAVVGKADHGNNGQLSLSNAATLADATLSSNNVGRIIAFKGLFAVQWRDVRSMQLRSEVIFIRVSPGK